MNWTEMNRPLCNRWVTLLVLAVIFVIEFVETSVNRSLHTSYSTHYGGFVSGVLMGIVLLRSPVKRCHKRYEVDQVNIIS
jgi:membrane associated rhomboid family serine protease